MNLTQTTLLQHKLFVPV